MGYLIIMMIVLSVFGLLLGWLNYKISKLKEDNELSIETISSIIALEKAMKKLNEALKIHEFRLDHQRDERYAIKKRLDILEAGHPDDEIDYGTVDDDGNITEVWFEGKRYVPEDKRNDIDYAKTDGDGNILAVWFHGKKYVPEDKRDEDPIVFYADGRVVAETTRPEEKLVLYKTYKGYHFRR